MLGDSRRVSGSFCRARATLREHAENRSESGLGGREKSAAGTATVGGDGGSYAIDEPPRSSREIVHPHTLPVCAKIAKIRRGKREPTQNIALGVGYQPTEANTGDRRGTGAKPAGPDEEDTAIFHWGEVARSSAVVFRGRLWHTGQEIGTSVGAALAVFEGVVERGEKLEPLLDSRIVTSQFNDAFESLVIREDSKLRAPEVTSKAFDDPDNAAGFHVERSPVPLSIEDSTGDVSDGPHLGSSAAPKPSMHASQYT